MQTPGRLNRCRRASARAQCKPAASLARRSDARQDSCRLDLMPPFAPPTAMVDLARRGRALPMVVHAVSSAVDAVHALVDRLPAGTQARPDMNRRDAVLA
jgi:hypothetical protein